LRADLKRLKRDTDSDKILAAGSGSSRAVPIPTQSSRKRPLAITAAAALILLVLAVSWVLWPVPAAKVIGSRQVTRDGFFKGQLVSDGSRIYFPEFSNGHILIAQVSTAGGETSAIQMPFPNANVFSISPDHSSLLVAGFTPGTPAPFWALPMPTGSLRRLADIEGNEARWSPDGRQLVFIKGRDIYTADPDGNHSRKIRSFSDLIGNIRFSPDSQHLRLTLTRPGENLSTLWDMKVDGSDLHRLFPGWKTDAMQCCGDWTADGRYYIFEVQAAAGTLDLWAVRENSHWFQRPSAPVQLTTGPMWYNYPVSSSDSTHIYANGELLQGELVRYDPPSHQFVPYLSGVSAGEADFSPDGQWIVYVSYPELTLWRSRIDGTQRTQLTYWPLYAELPRWSPDGKQIAFVGTDAGKPWKIFLISPEGGTPQELLPSDRQESDPTWSPDGKQIAFGRPSYGMNVSELDIQIVDLATYQANSIPGSHGLFSPRWSPDGRYLAALSSDSKNLMRFDFATRQWLQWLHAQDGTVGYPVWARDSQSIYIEQFYGSEPSLHHLKLDENRSTRFLSWDGLHRFSGVWGTWSGVAPEGSVLAVRDVSSHEMYALELELP
jgi:Tol biopolymer transport system component